ncbi:MAG TPA: hypothetical protein VF876_18005 [Burkholderiales bacterium]
MALAAGNAGAQSAARPDPADPAVRVPETAYRSAFEDYRKHELSRQVPWRDANDEVGRIGGHVGVVRDPSARGLQAPAAGAGAAQQAAPAAPEDAKSPRGRP